MFFFGCGPWRARVMQAVPDDSDANDDAVTGISCPAGKLVGTAHPPKDTESPKPEVTHSPDANDDDQGDVNENDQGENEQGDANEVEQEDQNDEHTIPSVQPTPEHSEDSHDADSGSSGSSDGGSGSGD